jgi:hypothetical protein
MEEVFVAAFMDEMEKISAKGGMKPGHPFRQVVEAAKEQAGVKKGMPPEEAKTRIPAMRKMIDKAWRSEKEVKKTAAGPLGRDG